MEVLATDQRLGPFGASLRLDPSSDRVASWSNRRAEAVLCRSGMGPQRGGRERRRAEATGPGPPTLSEFSHRTPRARIAADLKSRAWGLVTNIQAMIRTATGTSPSDPRSPSGESVATIVSSGRSRNSSSTATL